MVAPERQPKLFILDLDFFKSTKQRHNDPAPKIENASEHIFFISVIFTLTHF